MSEHQPEEIHDVEGDLQPEPRREVSPGPPWGGLITIVGLAIIVVFAVQNTNTVQVRFIWFDGESPLSLVILITAVTAIVLTALVGALYRRRRRRRRMEKEELRRLRGES